MLPFCRLSCVLYHNAYREYHYSFSLSPKLDIGSYGHTKIDQSLVLKAFDDSSTYKEIKNSLNTFKAVFYKKSKVKSHREKLI